MAPGPTPDAATVLWASGLYDIGFAVFHLCFWTLFRWPASLRSSGSVNTGITQTLNIVLTYCFAVYGGTLIWAGIAPIAPSPLLLIAGCGFWLLRAVLQPALFSMRNSLSVGMTAVFLAGSLLHALGAYLVAQV